MSKRIHAAALTALALLALPAAVPAQQAMQLTALDYIEIEQLIARYARAIDSCSNNGYDYADLFTPDGRFIPSVPGRTIPPIQGRERLAEISGGGSNGCRNVGWIEQGVRHIYTNHVITPTAEGATGVVDMLMIGLGGDPYRIAYDGWYEDVYVKTPDGWRFEQRTHHALLDGGQPVEQAALDPEPAPTSPAVPPLGSGPRPNAR